MKVITEATLRDEFRINKPKYFCIPEETILSPAAREYLQQYKIEILTEPPTKKETSEIKNDMNSEVKEKGETVVEEKWKPKYVDFETGAFYMEKPEHMCQLHGNLLVSKSHPRILLRGKLDSVQTMIILDQALISQTGKYTKLISDLNSILLTLQNIMKCEVLDEPLKSEIIIGFTHREIRERSHEPMKFFGIKQMVMPNYTMGPQYAMLNQVRATIREVEVVATMAFCQNGKCSRNDIIEELNRLSSAVHVMMCKWLAGEYQ